jgi:hypothetical protein
VLLERTPLKSLGLVVAGCTSAFVYFADWQQVATLGDLGIVTDSPHSGRPPPRSVLLVPAVPRAVALSKVRVSGELPGRHLSGCLL